MIVVTGPPHPWGIEGVVRALGSATQVLGDEALADPCNGGVYWETNPHRETGRYLFPGPTARHVLWMDVMGLRKSDPAYLDHVLAVVPSWRRVEDPRSWWHLLYALLDDVTTRRHRTWFCATEHVADEWSELCAWLDLECAAPDLRVPPERAHDEPHAEVFDALHDRLTRRAELDDGLVARVNATHTALLEAHER